MEDNEYMLSNLIGVSDSRDAVYVWSPQKVPVGKDLDMPEDQHVIRLFSGRLFTSKYFFDMCDPESADED